jgi:hypothetical protein
MKMFRFCLLISYRNWVQNASRTHASLIKQDLPAWWKQDQFT